MNQQGPTVENRELCSMLHGSLIGGGFGEEWRYIYIYIYESLYCAPEIIITSLINYTPA